MEEEVKEKIEGIKERIRGPDYFAISRVPKSTREWFSEFAKEEFCDDRGMCFKFLCDSYTGIIHTGIEHLELAIIDLDKRLSVIEQKEVPETKEERIRKMLSGKELGGKENG